MFRSHPSPHQIRDYGTVDSSGNGTRDWGQMIDISLDEPNSLIAEYVATPANSNRMLSVNDIRKIIQVTTDEVIASGKVDGLNNQSMKFVITLIHQSLRDSVCPAVSAPHMERLIAGTTEQLITHYHRSARTRERLMEWLAEERMHGFIHRLATKERVDESGESGVVRAVKEHQETGCFAWVWDLFR